MLVPDVRAVDDVKAGWAVDDARFMRTDRCVWPLRTWRATGGRLGALVNPLVAVRVVERLDHESAPVPPVASSR